MRDIALSLLGLVALFIASTGDSAWAQDDPNCWAGKRRTDLRTGEILIECMKEPEGSSIRTRLARIAELGAVGQKDAAYVIERLTDKDWDVRAEAARTLRMIGYVEATPQLVAAITPRDWRLTYEAMASLNALKAPQADAVLKRIADDYWLPSIADTARDLTMGLISPDFSFRLPFDYCNAKADQTLVPRCTASDTPDYKRYDVEMSDYRRSFWRQFRAEASLKGATRASLTLDVTDGKLIGTNHGEWGGELGFVNDRVTQTIIDDNVLAVVKRGNRIYAVTGLPGRAKGDFLWEVSRATDGRWSARPIWRLPGTPHEVVATPDGTIGFFGQFGSALHRTDDTFQWLACGPSEYCRRED